jgi:hypothetical protein
VGTRAKGVEQLCSTGRIVKGQGGDGIGAYEIGKGLKFFNF